MLVKVYALFVLSWAWSLKMIRALPVLLGQLLLQYLRLHQIVHLALVPFRLMRQSDDDEPTVWIQIIRLSVSTND